MNKSFPWVSRVNTKGSVHVRVDHCLNILYFWNFFDTLDPESLLKEGDTINWTLLATLRRLGTKEDLTDLEAVLSCSSQQPTSRFAGLLHRLCAV